MDENLDGSGCQMNEKRWRKEPGPRVEGFRDLDRSKVQAPGIARDPSGGFRLFYTGVGPGRPFPPCQGYILSAVSDDGLSFRPEPGIRLAPQPGVPHMSLRTLSPTVAPCEEGCWRMYFESRGPASLPTVICSAISTDMLHWKHEDGIRLQGFDGLGGPRYVVLPDGRARLFCCAEERGPDGERVSKSVVSAVTSDGIHFELEPGYRKRDRQSENDAVGITAADVIAPVVAGDRWTMVYSAWQDVPPGTVVPIHPSEDRDSVAGGPTEDFAAASIASDLAGYRSRIFVAHSHDGLVWGPGECAIEGGGHESDDLDAVHAEDMSLMRIAGGGYRMYYAACDRDGNWRIASAVRKEGD